MDELNELKNKHPAGWKEKRSTIRLNKRTLLLAGLILALFLLLALCIFLITRDGKTEPEPVITSELLKGQLLAIEELGTAAYYYTGVGKYENQSEFFGWKVPFTDKSFIITYDGVIKAGVKLDGVDVRVNDAKKTITVTLPKGEFLSHEIPEDSIQILDQSNGLFNSITIEDYIGFSSEQKEVMAQRAIDSGLLAEAEENARATVEACLSLVPGADEYTLTVKIAP